MEGNGEVTIYNGNYSEYRISLEAEKTKETKPSKKVEVENSPAPVVKKLSYKEQKELDDSESQIAQLENKISELTSSLLFIESTDYIQIQEVTKKIEHIQSELDKVTERWLELSEKINLK
ncbi:ABC transporter, partial [Pedobacter sp. HMWF019]